MSHLADSKIATMKIRDRVAIVVSSCDAFYDCWVPFLYSMEKWGADCPFMIYIISNFKSISSNSKDITFLKVGQDLKWGTNLKNALQKIPADYIIYLQEDYFLNKHINWPSLTTHIQYCIQNQIDYLRLTFPYIPGETLDKYYIKNSLNQAYAVCLQAGLWKKDTLEQLCLNGWTGWDFEYKVSSVIRERLPSFRFLGLTKSANGQISYVKGTGVRKGKWTYAGFRFLKKNGFNHLLKQRATEPMFWRLLDVDGWGRPFAKLLWRTINKIKNI